MESRRAGRCERHACDRLAARAVARRTRPAAGISQSCGMDVCRIRWRRRPQAALEFMDALVPLATAKAEREGKEIQAVIDSQGGGFHPRAVGLGLLQRAGAQGQVRSERCAGEALLRAPQRARERRVLCGQPALRDQLQGAQGYPGVSADVRVFDVLDADGKPLALFYCDYFKRDNKNGGAWMSTFVNQSTLLKTRPVVSTSPISRSPRRERRRSSASMTSSRCSTSSAMRCTACSPTPGTRASRELRRPATSSNSHRNSTSTGRCIPRSSITMHATTKPVRSCRRSCATRSKRAENFNQGYKMTEVLAAAELDMQWHTLPAGAPLQDPDAFQQQALREDAPGDVGGAAALSLDVLSATSGPADIPPAITPIYGRRCSPTTPINGSTSMAASRAANGERFRRMILSRGNTEDLGRMYADWRGRAPPSMR